MKRIKSNQFVLADGIFSGYLYFEGGKILQLTCDELPVEQEYDLTDCYVSAGFIDLHTHGGGGHPFEGTVEDVIEGCAFHLKHGTTAICPTIAAAPIAEMAQAAKNVEAAMRDPRVKGTILGSPLEGPYLSAAQCGAQCPRHITPPVAEDYLPLLKECSSIVRWSYAPENDAGERFAKALKQYGVVAAAGHTDAIYDDMKRAMAQGCNLVTHLYSCTSTVTRDHGFRRLGVIETAYLEDDLFVEIICDGKHLPSELIRLIYKLKGRGRIALITGHTYIFTAKERLVGYLRALSDHKIPYDKDLVFTGDYNFTTGYQNFWQLMELPDPPTAVFCVNDDITMGAITASREHQSRGTPPIAVFGYDCVEVCNLMTPSIPVVHQAEDEIGRLAGTYLMERLNGFNGPPRVSRLKNTIIY